MTSVEPAHSSSNVATAPRGSTRSGIVITGFWLARRTAPVTVAIVVKRSGIVLRRMLPPVPVCFLRSP